MLQQNFTYSFLTFYMKTKIGLEDKFVKVSTPNTILSLIPLGSTNKTVPINQIASVDSSFSLLFKSFIWGIIFTMISFSSMKSSIVFGLILFAYGILTILSSFQTHMNIHTTSGQVIVVSVIVFEKAKLQSTISTIEQFVGQRLDDTNNRIHTDRVIDAIKNSK